MKTKISLLVIMLLSMSYVSLYADGKSKPAPQSIDKQETAAAIKTVKEFYVAYSTKIAVGTSLDEAKLLPKYFTSKAIEKIKRIGEENGYNLVIYAQDFQDDAFRTITVTHVTGDWYAVAYLDTYEKICQIIPVRVIKQAGRYMIDDIAVK